MMMLDVRLCGFSNICSTKAASHPGLQVLHNLLHVHTLISAAGSPGGHAHGMPGGLHHRGDQDI